MMVQPLFHVKNAIQAAKLVVDHHLLNAIPVMITNIIKIINALIVNLNRVFI
jgi:hypothetical protein